MISSYPPAIRRQLLSKHFLISTMPEGALDDLVKFTTVARFEPHRVIFSKGDKGDCLYASCRAAHGSAPLPRFAADSTLEERGFELVWGFSCQVVILVSRRFFVRRCVQVRPACSAGDSPAGVKVRAP